VAAYRARRFACYPTVLDLCCGIGGDTIELARVCRKVVAVDVDPQKVAMARHNLAVYGLEGKVEFHVADATGADWTGDAVFIDPSRRVEGRRKIELAECEPPLDAVLAIVRNIGRGAVKCAPAMDYSPFEADASIEVISLDGECKEVVLWFGDLADRSGIQATVLPAGEHMVRAVGAAVEVKPPGKFIFEPDPAVIRAHLVEELAARFGLWKLDETTAYLSGDLPVESPFLRYSPVVRWLPFNLKKLNVALASYGIGRVDIKRRGFPLAPEELRSKLKLGGANFAILYCCRHAGKHIVVIGGG